MELASGFSAAPEQPRRSTSRMELASASAFRAAPAQPPEIRAGDGVGLGLQRGARAALELPLDLGPQRGA